MHLNKIFYAGLVSLVLGSSMIMYQFASSFIQPPPNRTPTDSELISQIMAYQSFLRAPKVYCQKPGLSAYASSLCDTVDKAGKAAAETEAAKNLSGLETELGERVRSSVTGTYIAGLALIFVSFPLMTAGVFMNPKR